MRTQSHCLANKSMDSIYLRSKCILPHNSVYSRQRSIMLSHAQAYSQRDYSVHPVQYPPILHAIVNAILL